VNGEKCTVCWHVDDLKISHQDEAVVTAFAAALGDIYEPKNIIHRGKVFDYLGLDLDFGTIPGCLLVSMIRYLQKVTEEWPEQLTSTKTNPASDNLFKIRDDDDRKILDEGRAKQFHQTVAQLLFLCMRARPDIQTAVSFLTTRVKEPDEDDWGKLRHVLMYLKGTLYMKRCLSADNLTSIHWWVDGSYGVHWDSKGHTGAMMSMGKGAIVSVSRKHKLNVGSSTEAELVSIADVLGMIMWCKYFMEAQGYTIDSNLLYQDNKSTILLAKNGRMSAGKHSKHIKNRFFLIADKVAQGDVEIQHRGADVMWADVNTKPLQGQMFREFRSHLMGIAIDYDDDVERRNTHPKLLPKVEVDGVVSKADLEVLVAATGLDKERDQQRGIKKRSISQQDKLVTKRRSVLNDAKYGPGNGPHWGTNRSRYPNLIKALADEPDPRRRRTLGESHRHMVECAGAA
jgi:hypothetical protein